MTKEILDLAGRLRTSADADQTQELKMVMRRVATALDRLAAQPQIPTYFKYGRDISDRGDQPQKSKHSTLEDIRACAWSTLIGFENELGTRNVNFIADQIARKATMDCSDTRTDREGK